jgi:methionyl-tRNA formyltransferase
LFREFVSLLADPAPSKVVQDEAKASLFMRKDINFKDVQVDLTAPAAQIHDKIRAFTFWEYQLPKISGREVWRSRLAPGAPSGAPGSIKLLDEWRAVVSGADGDVELTFSPYAQLFAWAGGQSVVLPPAWAAVPNLDLQNAKGWSALMVAAYNGNIDAARALVGAGASVEAANLRGTTPLMYAFTRMVQSGDVAVFTYLLSIGADYTRRDAKGLSISDYLPSEKRGDLRKLFPTVFS